MEKVPSSDSIAGMCRWILFVSEYNKIILHRNKLSIKITNDKGLDPEIAKTAIANTKKILGLKEE